ncbi:MAG: hypothetical protein ABL962_10415 [Fimbriimonadaceae bacterium]
MIKRRGGLQVMKPPLFRAPVKPDGGSPTPADLSEMLDRVMAALDAAGEELAAAHVDMAKHALRQTRP